jgi:hypothetical protein
LCGSCKEDERIRQAKIEALEEVFASRFQNVNGAWIISAHDVECMIGKLKAKGNNEDGS